VTDQELFNGLKRGDRKSIVSIYSSVFPVVKKWVLENNGDEADAYDVFQESLEAILLKIDSLNASFGGLVLRISKNKWIDKLRKQKTTDKMKSQMLYLSQQDQISSEEDLAIKEQLKYQLMEKYFSQLSSICQQLMALLKRGKTVTEVVAELSFSNANSLSRRKAACMERWSKLIKQDKEYNTLF